ncbi:PREDICTED: uncharacterized protein LOC105973345 [Erythranthe guttata]|uniref:uncharacterized protein LOC105973345 n=1 Tax=Erythranthe guttata TaxID=4155 RepID=UPI00064E0F45|nr:PREDICTED: uncharacterized protein LOC105973345 [Erythranthe guttata]|eukprot:XP_012853821.1 PREDICTED: uncharacterized protein LOC105973345 [Erythranthe guttata]
MGGGLCMSHAGVRVRSRVRVRSPSQTNYKKSTYKGEEENSRLSNEVDEFSFNSYLPDKETGNRVMVVIDSGPESKRALEWALSHTVQSRDTIILFHVAKQGTAYLFNLFSFQFSIDEINLFLSDRRGNGEIDERAYDLLRSAKNTCHLKRPEVNVEMAVQQGKEKGATIVEEAKRLKVSLLVMGHRKQSLLRRLQMIWTSKRSRSRVVDYCIQNANCMTIAVRRNNRKYGGYLITTKRHKNFWLLA